MDRTELNIFASKALPRLLSGILVVSMFGVAACTATDVAPGSNIDPSVTTLAELKLVEEFKSDGDLTVRRYQADAQGRFAIAITPLDGSERERAFGVAESAFTRICGSAGSGVGRTGSRAPFYNVQQKAHLIYMQCAGAPAATVSGG